jgi:putative serine protease PepD
MLGVDERPRTKGRHDVTDGSAWRHTAGQGAWASPTAAAAGPRLPGQPEPAGVRQPATAWWSDALGDPWRDPQAPAVVVTSAPAPDSGPDLEPPIDGQSAGRRGMGIVLTVAIVTALIAGALGGTLGYIFAARSGHLGGTSLGGNASTPPLAQRAPESVAGLVKKVLPSVVTIRVKVGGGGALGSGFIVSDNGYVVTNEHVVEGVSGDAVVTFNDSTTATGTVVGTDPESDLAVIKVNRGGLPAIEFGDSEALQVGDPVIAVGSPLALSNTVTYGIVSALDRPIRTNTDEGGVRYYSAVQTDAAVNQGNSGGPLFDSAGRVIGVNSVIGSLADNQEKAGNVGLAFAVPINQAKRVAQDIINTGKARRTVIGASIDESYRGSAGGARLSSVEGGGPAANAGLRAGDVVLKIGNAVVDEPWDVIALVRKYAPGTVIGVDFTRDGSRQTVRVTLVADAK